MDSNLFFLFLTGFTGFVGYFFQAFRKKAWKPIAFGETKSKLVPTIILAVFTKV
jgi:hypothetical protein